MDRALRELTVVQKSKKKKIPSEHFRPLFQYMLSEFSRFTLTFEKQ